MGTKTTIKINDEKSQKVQSEFNGIGSLNPQAIALPGTIVSILGFAFIAYKLDSEFASFMDKSTLRPNDIYGAGYEPVLKMVFQIEKDYKIYKKYLIKPSSVNIKYIFI